MTQVLVTFDVELCAGIHGLGMGVENNLAWFVFGTCPDGEFGLNYELRKLSDYGLKGVFFVDSLVAEVFGRDLLKRIVAPILGAGHEVQLHAHTEWLDHAPRNPVAPRRGGHLGDFSFADQCVLLEIARDHLMAAGAPSPTAFRAGNFGASDDTLRALAAVGIPYDSSFNAAFVRHGCRIGLPLDQIDPVAHLGVCEFPVSCIFDRPGNRRHAQICALSSREMREGLLYALATGQRFFNIVAHSFELVSRGRMRANRALVGRFETLLATLADRRTDLPTIGFGDLAPFAPSVSSAAMALPPNLIRTAQRMGEQIVANMLYEHMGTRRMHGAERRKPAPALAADAD